MPEVGYLTLLVEQGRASEAFAVPQKTKVPWRGAAQSLYRALLAPTEAQLSGKTKLVICPDRALWEGPFAVLTDRQGTPLLTRFTLSYANPTPSSGDDGFLTAREIFDLDLSRIELVVLSAGCPTQVLWQWAVDDSSTATLMTRFYAGLAKGTGKSAALQQAARYVRREPSHSHPYDGAPFVLIGDLR